MIPRVRNTLSSYPIARIIILRSPPTPLTELGGHALCNPLRALALPQHPLQRRPDHGRPAGQQVGARPALLPLHVHDQRLHQDSNDRSTSRGPNPRTGNLHPSAAAPNNHLSQILRLDTFGIPYTPCLGSTQAGLPLCRLTLQASAQVASEGAARRASI
jgi:hypothetical protein